MQDWQNRGILLAMQFTDLLQDGALTPKRFRTTEYHRLIEAGVLGEDDHVELLEGVIVQMTPQGRPHARFLSTLNGLLVPALGGQYRVRVQLPLTLDESSEPEPDLAVVTRQAEDEAPQHPSTALLVIEVADSSVRADRLVKSRLYARARVVEYWIANVRLKTLEIYTDPDAGEERYRAMRTVGSGSVRLSAVPAVELSVGELFA
jgi:Uma2 family endonuclease